MNKLTKVILITLFTVPLFIIVPVAQAQAGPKVSPKLVKLGKHYQKKFGGPSTQFKGSIPKSSMIKMLTLGWKSFGYSNAQAQRRAKLNYKQVMVESSARPYAKQSSHDGSGLYGGGLFQLIPATFKKWQIPGHSNRFNATDNILATINIQINSRYMLYAKNPGTPKNPKKVKVLSGKGGWYWVGGKNPYSPRLGAGR
jgi:hypothetical protein